jgi:hypothetical protein
MPRIEMFNGIFRAIKGVTESQEFSNLNVEVRSRCVLGHRTWFKE